MKAALVGLIGCRAGLKAFVAAAGESTRGGGSESLTFGLGGEVGGGAESLALTA